MIDFVEIFITPGAGGNGAISFRREKFAPRGGPDGGDGGKGGDVILKAIDNTHLLRHLQYKKTFIGESGGDGSANNRSGKDGRPIFIDVPVGTIISVVQEDGKKTKVADLTAKGQEFTIGKGGLGGRGNSRYAGPQNREPLIAEAGHPTGRVRVELEVQLIADVAVIGVPNAGKSSLLSSLTGANPQVADYPFTTLDPVLGVVERKAKDIVIVEIPGLIENAHIGVGLGDEFLRHAQRTGMTLHLLDGLSGNVIGDYNQTRREMKLYDRKLTDKPEVVVITKIDLPQVKENLKATVSELASNGIHAIGISSMSGEGTKELVIELENNLAIRDGQNEDMDGQLVKGVPIIITAPKKETAIVERDGNELIVKSGGAERLVNRIDLEDTRVRVQLIRELDRMGILKALEKAGVKTGSLVKIGNHELLWQ